MAGPWFGLAECLGWMAVHTTTMVSVSLAGSLIDRTIGLLCRLATWSVTPYRSFIASFGFFFLDWPRRREYSSLPPLE